MAREQILQEQLDELQVKHATLRAKLDQLHTRHEDYKKSKEKEIRTLTKKLAAKREELKIFHISTQLGEKIDKYGINAKCEVE